jgi:hypothetical protein
VQQYLVEASEHTVCLQEQMALFLDGFIQTIESLQSIIRVSHGTLLIRVSGQTLGGVSCTVGRRCFQRSDERERNRTMERRDGYPNRVGIFGEMKGSCQAEA